MKTGYWLRYSTTPNVTTLFTESSQAINFAFTVFAANLTWSLLIFYSDHKKFSHPFISRLIELSSFLQQKCADIAYFIQYDNRLAATAKLGIILLPEGQLWNDNDKNGVYSSLIVCNFSV